VIVMDEGSVLMDGTPVDIFARADELRAVGLDVPIVTSLGQRLRAQGWTGLPDVVLSNEQLKEIGVLEMRDLNTGGDLTRLHEVIAPTARGAVSNLAPDVPEVHQQGAAPGDQRNKGHTVPYISPLHHAPTAVELNGTHPTPLFELRNLSHTYLRDTPFAVQSLNGLSLSIPEGQTTALVGPTKAGKSTVVDLLAGLIKPATSTFFFGSDDVGASSFDIERIRSIVGVVFQSPDAQIFEDTVGKDVSFGPRRKKIPVAESRRLVQESLEAVGLLYEDFRSRYTYALSGGQKRRVAIAGVLALQPKAIIFDEPTAGLDPRGRRELLELIARLKQRHGLTIIYTSSGLDDVIGLADTIYILDQGHTVLSGTPREILQHADQLVALDIALPEAAQIALALHEIIPTMRTDVLNLEELEAEIMNVRVTR